MPVAKRTIGKQSAGKPKAKRRIGGLFQLKITLADAPLPIWRRVIIKSDTPLSLVHEIFQISMGWWNFHLHDFIAHDRHFGDIETADGDKTVEDHNNFTLIDLVSKVGDRFEYDYDFGDSWHHDVVLEHILHIEEASLAACIAGKRACPPEDVGGVEGYRQFVEIIEDPQNEERMEKLEWVGGDFDPDSFDMRSVNLRLLLLDQALSIS